MRFGTYNLIVLVLIPVMFVNTVKAEPVQTQEYKIKAAFLYNFIKFVDWPDEKPTNEKTITIGIIGKNPFGKAFESVKDKQVKDKKVIIKQFQSLEESKLSNNQIEALRRCHVLFVCHSEKQQIRKIISTVKDHSVLTIADMPDFLESGGMIYFLKEDEKIRFEINNTAAKQERLKIRSKLLRLAKRVIGEEISNGVKK